MRQLPYSHDAEVAILGTLLVYPDSVNRINEHNLVVDDFYNTEHQKIFRHMLDIIEAGNFLDATTLISRLRDHHELDSIGGVDFLFYLTTNVVLATLKHYVDVVQEKAQIRRLISVAQLIVDQGFDSTTEVKNLLDFAEKGVLEVTQDRQVSDMLSSQEVVAEFLANLAKIQENRDRITGLKTGFESLNRVTNGLQRGDLIILAARPSVGKTTVCTKPCT
ncbi:hypothetical protein MGH68_00130 [Erysipelothrix sp. D19-032]